MSNEPTEEEMNTVRAKGDYLMDLLAKISFMDVGKSVDFTGRVFVKGESGLASIFEGDMTLTQCYDSEDERNYRLSRKGSFTVPVTGLGSWVLSAEVNHIVPNRQKYFPFLYAHKANSSEVRLIIESLTEPEIK
jgi:hypothetical protein